MRDSMAMLAFLQDMGFTPADDGFTFDKSTGTRYTDSLTQVVMNDGEVSIIAMTGNEVERWRVTLTDNAPLQIFAACVGHALSEMVTTR